MIRHYSIICLVVLLLSACKKEESDTTVSGAFMEIQLQNVVDGQPLALNTTYTNSFNEPFQLTEYKYYISNLELLSSAQTMAIPNSYFLIDAANPTSQKVKTSIIADTYTALTFLIGIDSTRQVTGGPSGVIDPTFGLYWDQNLGYMAAKLSGTSTSSGAPGNLLQHHIGGFEGPFNTLRRVYIPLPAPLTLVSGNTLQVNLQAELLRWFDGLHPMSIAENPSILQPGPDAVRIANNYSGQFSLISVEIK